jgi:hypothetical protein
MQRRSRIILVSITVIAIITTLAVLFFLTTKNRRYLIFYVQCNRDGGHAEMRDRWPPVYRTGFWWTYICHANNRLSDEGKICKTGRDCYGTCEPDSYADYLDESISYKCSNDLYTQSYFDD